MIYMPIIPTFERLRQEALEVKDRLSYPVRLFLRKNKDPVSNNGSKTMMLFLTSSLRIPCNVC